jgi:hypothetical protein
VTKARRVVHPRQDLDCGGTGWCVYEAWRTESDLGLAYFIRADFGPGDRRALLGPGQGIKSLGVSELEALWSEATELTVTERRVIDGEGDVWLAQDIGPIWSEGNRASDGTGIHLRCVSRALPPVLLREQASTSLSDDDLIQALEGERV